MEFHLKWNRIHDFEYFTAPYYNKGIHNKLPPNQIYRGVNLGRDQTAVPPAPTILMESMKVTTNFWFRGGIVMPWNWENMAFCQEEKGAVKNMNLILISLIQLVIISYHCMCRSIWVSVLQIKFIWPIIFNSDYLKTTKILSFCKPQPQLQK